MNATTTTRPARRIPRLLLVVLAGLAALNPLLGLPACLVALVVAHRGGDITARRILLALVVLSATLLLVIFARTSSGS